MDRSFRPALWLFLFIPCLSVTGHAQLGPVDGATATPIPGAGHDYLQDLVDTVNPADGSVSVRINVPTPPNRGFTLPFSFNYDSGGVWQPRYDANGTMITASNVRYLSSGGWTYGVPRLDLSAIQLQTQQNGREIYCPIYTSFAFSDAAGTRHSVLADAAPDTSSPCITLDGRTQNRGADDLIQEYQASNLGSLYLADSGGTVYNFGSPASTCPIGSSNSKLPSTIEDSNGNLITFSGPPQNCNGVFSVQDSLGRTEISSSGFGSSGNTVTISGLQQSYSVEWGTATGSMQVPYTLVDSSQPGCNAFAGGPLGGTSNVISAINLPNGQTFSFNFDPSYGLLNQIIYPSGASISYVWEINPLSAYFQYPSEGPDGEQGPVCEYQYGTFAISHRYVYNTSGSMILEQDFTYSATSWNASGTAWTNKQTKVTTTDKVSGVVSKVTYSYTPIAMALPPYIVNMPQPQVAVEGSIVYQDGGGHTLKTVNKTWNDPFELNSVQTVLPLGSGGSETSETDYSYGAGAQITQELDYDFGSSGRGNLLKNTITTYQAFGTQPTFPSSSPIFNRACRAITYDGSNNRYAETDIYYDNGTTLCPSTEGSPSSITGVANLTGHDETNYGASSSSPRGNATQVVKQCFLGSTTCASGNPKITYVYDETGHATSMTDPNLNTTSYSYADDFVSTNSSGFTTTAGDPPSGKVTNAYLTKIAMPTTSGIAHVESFAYGYNDGELTESIDQNSQQTTYKYNDSLGRLTETDYPDGGQTLLTYNDSVPSVSTSKKINATQSIASTTVMDGLGHAVQTQLTSDPLGTTFTATNYDGNGRSYQAYNPTRCNPPTTNCGSATWGVTTYTYDALGRTIQVVNPDSSTRTISYSGRANIATDEGNGNGNVQSVSQVDGLGHLTSVCEVTGTTQDGITPTPQSCGLDITATGFLTSYSYDPLGNLLAVSQGGLNGRSFGYDSLSRLASATNPESGTVGYAYDGNGNLITRIAPEANQTSAAKTTTTAYTYDALNRLTSKTYSHSDNTAASPPVYTFYDLAQSWGGVSISNPIGRAVQFNLGNNISGFVNSYDPMGRVINQWQCTPVDCGISSVYFTYTYDLLGEMLTANGNANDATYTNTYDTAGNLLEVQSSLSDSQHPGTLITLGDYSAMHNPLLLNLGNGLAEGLAYTNRGWNNFGQLYNSAQQTLYSFTLGFAPDGDVTSANDSANGNWTYTYGALNRIMSGACSSDCPPTTSVAYG